MKVSLGSTKFLQVVLELILGPLVWVNMGYSLIPIRVWHPAYCCVPKAHFFTRLFVAGVWVVWLPLGWYFDGMLPGLVLWAFSFSFLSALPGLWAGFLFCFSSVQGLTWFLFGWSAYRPV